MSFVSVLAVVCSESLSAGLGSGDKHYYTVQQAWCYTMSEMQGALEPFSSDSGNKYISQHLDNMIMKFKANTAHGLEQ